jgi:AcrR family transcriptional regulator
MQDDYTEVQRKIINTARELFVKKGFKGTTVRDIATESGTNVAMVNYYFRSKEKLFDAIFEEAFSILSEKIFYWIDLDLPFNERIRNWVYSYYDVLLEYPYLPLFVMNELSVNPYKLSKRFYKYPYMLFVKITGLLKTEEAKGTIRPVSVPDLLLNIISLSIFPFVASPIISQFLNMQEKQYMELVDKHREQVVDFIIRALKPDI